MDEEDAINVAGPSTSRAFLPTDTNGSDTADMANQEAGASGGMSKSAMKKAAKRAKFEALKPARRAAERARKKENAAHLREGYASGTLSEKEKQAYEEKRGRLRAKVQAGKRDKKRQEDEYWGGGVVVDLGFDELMTDQEISSMASQVSYVYSANRQAERPFASLVFSSFSAQRSPRLFEQMQKANYERWTRCTWKEGDIDQLDMRFSIRPNEAPRNAVDGANGANGADTGAVPEPLQADETNAGEGVGKQLVYLSADSPDEIHQLSEDEVYIIGGLVDRNRHKLLCQNKAEKLGIRTARLPIGKYLENLPTRKVLTVNQVFQILTEYIAKRSWAEAFEAVIPQRKFEAMGRKGKRRLHKEAGGTDSIAGDEDGEAGMEDIGGATSEDEGNEVDESQPAPQASLDEVAASS